MLWLCDSLGSLAPIISGGPHNNSVKQAGQIRWLAKGHTAGKTWTEISAQTPKSQILTAHWPWKWVKPVMPVTYFRAQKQKSFSTSVVYFLLSKKCVFLGNSFFGRWELKVEWLKMPTLSMKDIATIRVAAENVYTRIFKEFYLQSCPKMMEEAKELSKGVNYTLWFFIRIGVLFFLFQKYLSWQHA